MNLAVIGTGCLYQAITRGLAGSYTITGFGRSDTDLRNQTECDALVSKLLLYDSIVYTAAVYDADVWQTWTINTSAPCYIISQLVLNQYRGHVVVVSSHAANWTSWPDIDINRLNYNNSKHALSHFVKGLQQAKTPGRFSLLEPSRFQSSMGGPNGQDINNVVEAIGFLLQHPARSITV